MRPLIAEYLQIAPEQITFFWKGIVALYAILKSIGIQPGDEVILPAFTCIVVVNPILYLKAKPVYVDINPRTYTLDVSQIEEHISPRTRAILAQNTFGLAPDLDRIFEIANKHNLFVIEDCAHGFGGFYKNRPNGTIANASFFSTQWNKPFSTGIGGFAVVRDLELASKLQALESQFIQPSTKDELVLKALLFLHRQLNSQIYWPAIKTYRWLSERNLILGSSQGSELESTEMPPDFEKRMSPTQLREGEKQLSDFKDNLAIRRNIARYYDDVLKDLSIEPPYIPEYAEHTFLKYPLLVKDRAAFFRQAIEAKIEIGDWFLSPLHPITKDLERFGYEPGSNPVGEYMAQHVVNLPTHPGIRESDLKRIARFLKKQRENIIDSRSEEESFLERFS